MLERIGTGDMIEWGELDGQLYGTRYLSVLSGFFSVFQRLEELNTISEQSN